jgi:hypothetical protein
MMLGFSEQPDDYLWKMAFDSSEIEATGRALAALSADSNLPQKLGDLAYRYVLSYLFSWSVVVP